MCLLPVTTAQPLIDGFKILPAIAPFTFLPGRRIGLEKLPKTGLVQSRYLSIMAVRSKDSWLRPLAQLEDPAPPRKSFA
ncbi:hypothetical protein D3C73_1528390 [compost metagenome]